MFHRVYEGSHRIVHMQIVSLEMRLEQDDCAVSNGSVNKSFTSKSILIRAADAAYRRQPEYYGVSGLKKGLLRLHF